MKYESVIGLEVHVELKTKTKIFCGCSTEFGAEPNTHVCPVCLGLPGVLPVLNKEVLHYAVKAGLALHCDILPFSKFDRKNYYYPDLPKNFQTSQFDLPICKGGYIDIDVDGKQRRIHLTRIHMEEDAGKLVHSGGSIANSDSTSVDYNRTGVPLLEIVGEPELRSGAEARAYLEKLRSIMQYLGVSDCRLEEGSMRCDANISVRPVGSGPRRKSRTSTPSAPSRRGLNTKPSARLRSSTKAVRSSRLRAAGMKPRALPSSSASKKGTAITVTSRNRTSFLSKCRQNTSNRSARNCRKCPMPAASASRMNWAYPNTTPTC